MNKRYLLLFTDFYPFPGWETYLQPEMKFLPAQFERIFIFSNHQAEGALVPELPPNVEAFFISPHISFPEKLGSLRFFFSKLFWDELKWVRKQYGLRVNISIIKIALVSHWHANRYKKRIEEFLQERNLHKQDIFLYSYWADYRAVAAAMLHDKYGFTAITRAHGWDVYFERHPVPYLPFRKFISDSLSTIFFVSENGKNYFHQKMGENAVDKLRIARLAIEKNKPNPSAANNAFTIVSCARLVPLKRVNLIADILQQIDDLPVHWIHFGSGNNEESFRNEVQQKLEQKKNIRFDFRGETSHEELMQFYITNHVDLFLLTSEYEGMPFAIIEALSFGIPVMATNVGGISEAINKESGLLLEKDFDPLQAAQTIIAFAKQPAEKISAHRQNAFETWNNLFNAEKNFPQFIQCLLKLQPPKNKLRE